MKVAVFGTGYVGLTTGVCLADLGHTVTCVDIDEKKLDMLKQGLIPFYEPGLRDLVLKNADEQRLFFTSDGQAAVRTNDILFIAVGTPSLDNGGVDISQVEQVVGMIGETMDGYRLIVDKSTVPPGTSVRVSAIIKERYDGEFDVASNPEFLREGSAIYDFMHPDRVVIGTASTKAGDMLVELYKPLEAMVVQTDVPTAEMIKYASNAYCSMGISFINSVASICEKVGADVTKVSEAMRYDKRIGVHAFIDAGIGYGGSCFPKDTKGFVAISQELGVPFEILEAVEKVNYRQRELFIDKILATAGDVKGMTVAVWGLAFKPMSDDMREAPSVTVIKALQKRGAAIRAFDPVARVTAEAVLPDIEYAETPLSATAGAGALVIVTEWDEFKNIDKAQLKESLEKPVVIDGRNIYDPAEMERLGFTYVSVGR